VVLTLMVMPPELGEAIVDGGRNRSARRGWDSFVGCEKVGVVANSERAEADRPPWFIKKASAHTNRARRGLFSHFWWSGVVYSDGPPIIFGISKAIGSSIPNYKTL
jgi:hypothetical protein